MMFGRFDGFFTGGAITIYLLFVSVLSIRVLVGLFDFSQLSLILVFVWLSYIRYSSLLSWISRNVLSWFLWDESILALVDMFATNVELL